jgi:multicomponent Na+:H+ antiporter subunit D
MTEMEPVVSIAPLLAVGVAAAAGLAVLALGRHPNLREGCSLLAGAAQFALVMTMAPVVWDGGVVAYRVVDLLPGVAIAFRVDGLGLLFGGVASFLWMLTTVYSMGYMRSLQEHAQTRYFSCFALSLSAALGVAFSGNLFTLFLFYEVLTFVTYPLVIHHETQEAFEGGRKYMVYLLGTSKTFLLVALLLTYLMAGTLELKPGGMFPADADPVWVTVIFVLFIAGLTKAAIMPLHNWLPTAMIAPTPVSALLHAVAVVKVGVFSVARVMVDVFGVDLLERLHVGIPTAAFVSVTILGASVIALSQDNLKLRLAYSTVSQLSYVILGAALLTPGGLVGSVMQIAAHAFGKITLFFCAGAIYVASHKTKVSEMSGLARRMPWTMGAFTVGALSLIGAPPLAGFASKWWLAVGAIEAQQPALLFVLLSSTMLNAAYFLPIIYKAYFEAPAASTGAKASAERQEAPWTMVVPLSLTAVGTVMLGLYSEPFLALARQVIR